MAHNATLKLGAKNYKIIECEYEIVQPVKENGQPAGHPTSGIITLSVVTPDNSDMYLHSWMQSPTEHKDGMILFEVVNKGLPSKKNLFFRRAYCVRLYEYFNGQGEGQMYTKLTLSATEISFGELGTVIFKNDF